MLTDDPPVSAQWLFHLCDEAAPDTAAPPPPVTSTWYSPLWQGGGAVWESEHRFRSTEKR